MTLFSFTDCCALLAVDPKTLRLWLHQANIALQAHPTDARLNCLSAEDLWQLALAHTRPLQPHACAGLAPDALPRKGTVGQVGTGGAAWARQEADLIERVTHLETEIAAMRAQMTQLALALLNTRERHDAAGPPVQVGLVEPGVHSVPPTSALPAQTVPCQTNAGLHRQWEWHPTEKRARTPLIPLIE